MFIGYLILSILLSGIAFGVYSLFFKGNPATLYRKRFLHFCILSCLLLPWLALKAPINTGQFMERFTAKAPLEVDDELIACYEMAISETEFCNCEELSQENIIVFHDNSFYNTLLLLDKPIRFLLLAIGVIVFLSLFIQIFNLYRQCRNLLRDEGEFNGQRYTLLHIPNKVLAASFCFFKPYILWNPVLYNLKKTEQEQVLLHEIAHIKNKDTWEQIALGLVQIVWFINPFFYFIKNELDLLSELRADDYAVQESGAAQSYASLLLKLKETEQLAFAKHFGQNPLKLRVMHLLKPEKPRIKVRFLPMAAWFFCLIILAGVATASFANQQIQAIKEYEILQHEYQETGKNYFCKTCLWEKFDHEHCE